MTNPTDREVLQLLLDAGEASQANVMWGNSCNRNVIIFRGKKYQYNSTGDVNKISMKSISPLYRRMSLRSTLVIQKIAEEKYAEAEAAMRKFEKDYKKGLSKKS